MVEAQIAVSIVSKNINGIRFTVIVRKTRGSDDIDAACGQLAGDALTKQTYSNEA